MSCLCVLYRNDRRSKLISGPSNFSHVEHMGPHQGMQVLIDLPQAQAKAGMRHSMVPGPTSIPSLRHNGSGGGELSTLSIILAEILGTCSLVHVIG